MHRHTMTASLVLALCTHACAQGTTTDDDVLSGPSVTDTQRDAPPTIVRRAFDGTLERPEGLPELAALDALELGEAARGAVDDALAERNALIDSILAEHLDLFGRMIQAFQARGGVGNGAMDRDGRREMMQLFREVGPVVGPVVERGSLRDEIAGALVGEARDHFVRMLEEYDEAVREDGGEGRGMRPSVDRPTNRGVERGRGAGDRRAVMGVIREFGSSYQRVIGQRVEDYRAMLDALDIDPETRGKIEAAFQGSLSQDYDSDEERAQARARVMRSVLEDLDGEQRRQLISELRRVRGDRAGGSSRE
ncbi:MAG: hypothetical protein Tsb0013_06560 [Phycisphaerales bacterium]